METRLKVKMNIFWSKITTKISKTLQTAKTPPMQQLWSCSRRRTATKVYEIQDCFTRGRRPAVNDFISSLDMKWYQSKSEEMKKARSADTTWVLLNPKNWENL